MDEKHILSELFTEHCCSQCFHIFACKSSLNVHKKIHDPDRARKYFCNVKNCGKSYFRLVDRDRHKKSHEFGCICSKIFYSKEAYKRHLQLCSFH